jgi:hypothetical protein
MNPYVLDPPGRRNNLYKKPYGGLETAINEQIVLNDTESMACKYTVAAGNGTVNYCFGDRQEIPMYPDRRMQFDTVVDNVIGLRNQNKPDRDMGLVIISLLVVSFMVYQFR